MLFPDARWCLGAVRKKRIKRLPGRNNYSCQKLTILEISLVFLLQCTAAASAESLHRSRSEQDKHLRNTLRPMEGLNLVFTKVS